MVKKAVISSQIDPAGNRILERRSPDEVREGSMPVHFLDIRMSYDRQNRLVQVEDSLGAAASYTYDCLNNRLTEKYRVNETAYRLICYKYDAAGRLIDRMESVDLEDVGQETRPYCKKAFLHTSASEQGKVLAAYAYDTAGRISNISFANGISTSYSYDTERNLAAMETRDRNGSVLLSYSYQYDRNGNRTGKKDLKNGNATAYVYDAMQRLSEVTYPETGKETYRYDAAGNRIQKQTQSYVEDYLYDERNRLTQKSSTNPDLPETENTNITTYQYDLQGSLLKEQSADFCKQYLYNDFHQCIQTDVIRGREADAERLVQQNLYDGEGLRFAIIENGKRTGFITDGWDNVTELDGNGRVRKRIIRGLGIVASEDTEESADTANVFTASYHYYHGNERMDVEYITDEAGNVRNSYAYDAFGAITASAETIPNRYTYNGESYDKTTEQYYLRKRFYNPKLCRFMQEDEYRGDGLNLYAFCANNPVMYVDPSGYGSVTYTDRPIVVDGNEIGSTNYKTGEYLKILIDEEYLPNSNISQTVVSDETSNQVYKDFYQSDSKVRGKTIENTVASANRSDYIQIGNAFNDKYPIIDLVNESSVVSIKSLNQFCSTYKTDNIPDVDKVADKVMQYYSDIDNINISVNGKNNITKELLVALYGKNNDFKMEVQEEVNKRIEQKYESGDTGASKNSKTKCRIV